MSTFLRVPGPWGLCQIISGCQAFGVLSGGEIMGSLQEYRENKKIDMSKFFIVLYLVLIYQFSGKVTEYKEIGLMQLDKVRVSVAFEISLLSNTLRQYDVVLSKYFLPSFTLTIKGVKAKSFVNKE
jgi:hypothetical protein